MSCCDNELPFSYIYANVKRIKLWKVGLFCVKIMSALYNFINVKKYFIQFLPIWWYDKTEYIYDKHSMNI